jgi:tRNA(His) 5'-end guanylyltransferase
MDLGDRMKLYEKRYSGERFMPLLPVLARIDGRGFSRWTKGLQRPYDAGLSDLMMHTTKEMLKETHALVGYTQSDESSLLFFSDKIGSSIFFDGKVMKMVSVMTSIFSVVFHRDKHLFLSREKQLETPAFFDCRVWQVPNEVEAANYFLWREQDATKNSISMAASHYYSHKELQGVPSGVRQELLFQKGVNWNDYPDFFKRGSFVQKRNVERQLSETELFKLPEKHNLRQNPDLKVVRSEYVRVDMPPFGSVVDKIGVLFNGDEPKSLLMSGKDSEI